MSDDALADAAPHLAPTTVAAPAAPARSGAGRPWRPKRVLITASAARWPLAAEAAARAGGLGAEVTWLKGDRLPSLKGASAAEGYRLAKSTLAVVVAPPSKRRLQPIPPSADWRFDLAEGCPAHCQYCYLAGSLQGAPVTRLYANLPETLAGLEDYLGRGRVTSTDARRAVEGTTFEASCYTDPLGIEHLSGALAETIRHFGAWKADVALRFTTKFADVDALLGLAHGKKTRARFSVNAEAVVRRFEGGTAALDARLLAMRRMAGAGYPVGLTVAPIMPIEGWRESYDDLLARAAAALANVPDVDLTVELITHRFTPISKEVLSGWYPASDLEMDERARAQKRNKFGSVKWVYPKAVMDEMRGFFAQGVRGHLPGARWLYWT